MDARVVACVYDVAHGMVVVVVVAVTMAEFIAYAVAAAFDGVYEVMFTEEREGSEDVRLVNGLDPALQFG